MKSHRIEPLEPRRLLALVIDYPMEEGSGATVADAAPAWGSQDATLAGGAQWTTTDGQVLFSNRAISLNGTDASLLTDDIGQHIGQSATVSLWIKTTDVGAPDPASSAGLLGGTDGGRSIYWGWIDDCDRINFTVPGTPPPGGRDTVTSDFAINDGTWYHVLMTRDINTGEISLYVNGLRHDRAIADPAPRDNMMLRDIGTFQNWDDGSSPRRYVKASIDKLHVYDHAMSDSEAALEFDPRGAPIATPTNVQVVYTGATSVRLAWGHVVGASGYEIWRSLADKNDFQLAALAPPRGYYTDTGLERLTSYAYRIRAINPFGTSAFSTTVTGTTTAPPHPSPLYIKGSAGEDDIRVERHGNDIYVWNSAVHCCDEPYHVTALQDFEGIVIDALEGSDSIHVDAGSDGFFPHFITINTGPGIDAIRVTGKARFLVHAGTVGRDDLTLGGGAEVLFDQDELFDDWTFEGPATIRFDDVNIEINDITPHAGTHIDIGRGTLRLFKSANEPLMLRRLHDLARSARNADPRWTGVGITSSALGHPLLGIAVGYVTTATYTGDVNHDRKINSDDYFRIDSGFLAQPASPTYAQGDFNYDGMINSDDYFLIDSAYLGQTPALPFKVEVPPPGTAAVAAPAVSNVVTSARGVLFSRDPIRQTRKPQRRPARGALLD